MASTTDPMETVRHYVDCFNKSDVNGMAAACDVPMTILDGIWLCAATMCGTEADRHSGLVQRRAG